MMSNLSKWQPTAGSSRRASAGRGLLLIAASLVAGCASDELGTGSFDVALSGGMALQEGFPHTEGDREHAFADGWTLSFDEWVMAVGNVKVTDPEDGDALVGSWDGPAVVDIRADGGKSQPLTVLADLSASRLDLQFDVLAGSTAMDNRNVDPAVVTEMEQRGCAYYITGQAAKDARTVRFQLCLDVPTHYFDCTNGKDGTKGVAIEADKTVGAYVYAHAHHLWWDTLAAGGESLRFDAWAAVAGADDLVTEAELEQQDLTDFRDENGAPLLDEQGHALFYDTGTALKQDELNLLAFVRYAARSGVHFNGVGLCNMSNLD